MDAWLRAGQAYPMFWELSLREIDVILRAHAKRLETEQRLRRLQSYELGQLMRIAVNAPDKFPELADFLGEGPRQKSSSDADIAAFFKAHANAQAQTQAKPQTSRS